MIAKRPRGLGKRAWVFSKCIRSVMFWLKTIRIIKLKVENRENVPRKGAVILAGNHPSIVDPLVVWAPLWRLAVGVAAIEIWLKNPIVAALMNMLGNIPLQRFSTESARQAMQTADEYLAHDGVVMIFPEGGCVPKGETRKYKSGVYWMAKRSGAPVIPVTLIGTNDLMPLKVDRPKRRGIYLSKKVRVIYGEPMLASDYDGPASFLAALRHRIELPLAG